jgi:hypothetical protein
MHFKVLDVIQGAVHAHHDPDVHHMQGQAHGEVQEGQKAHQIDQHEWEIVIGQEELVSCSSDYSTRWLAIK